MCGQSTRTMSETGSSPREGGRTATREDVPSARDANATIGTARNIAEERNFLLEAGVHPPYRAL